MKNKKLLLLPLFLLVPATAQCMEKAIINKPKTMQKIRDNHEYIIKMSVEHGRSGSRFRIPFDTIFFQESWLYTLEQLKKQHTPILTWAFTNFEIYKNYRHEFPVFVTANAYQNESYSLLGIAVIAIKIGPDYQSTKWNPLTEEIMRNLYLKKVQETPSFAEKKEFIQEFRKLIAIDPTPGDKELDIFETWKEHGPTIIKKKLLLQYSESLSHIEELVNYISLLIFETELLL